MPYKSESQARLMRAVAHSPGFAKKVGIPQAVGRKFESHRADGPKEHEMKKPLPPFMMKGKEPAAKKAAPKGKMPPMFAKKAPKKMMGGGSCK